MFSPSVRPQIVRGLQTIIHLAINAFLSLRDGSKLFCAGTARGLRPWFVPAAEAGFSINGRPHAARRAVGRASTASQHSPGAVMEWVRSLNVGQIAPATIVPF
jgi:hypothetical protein